MGGLREAGALDQVAALLARDPATQVTLDDPGDVADLVGGLREAGALDQVAALGDRVATQVTLDDPFGVVYLLGELRKAGADDQVAALLTRDPDTKIALDDPGGVASPTDRVAGGRSRRPGNRAGRPIPGRRYVRPFLADR
ncbi:hypothetical protein [Actinomadura sp. 9N215]|uniref:hypothetical protein n=1 Tax=Actinomadura sp. 9N215 TaxID=3375150 RepID=UPI0037B10EF8